MTPSNLVDGHEYFAETYFLHFQVPPKRHYPPTDYTVS